MRGLNGREKNRARGKSGPQAVSARPVPVSFRIVDFLRPKDRLGKGRELHAGTRSWAMEGRGKEQQGKEQQGKEQQDKPLGF